jgi:hypothetical protein
MANAAKLVWTRWLRREGNARNVWISPSFERGSNQSRRARHSASVKTRKHRDSAHSPPLKSLCPNFEFESSLVNVVYGLYDESNNSSVLRQTIGRAYVLS